MAKFSAEAFKKELQKKADKSARSQKTTVPIAGKAREVMHDVIEKNVYEKYTPALYERRGELGGLLDDGNIFTTVSGNHISIENVAEPNESIFETPLREDPKGLLYKWIDEGLIDTSIFNPYKSAVWIYKGVGMTEKIDRNKKLKDFTANTIIENMK